MKRILYVTNIPSPYVVDFMSELGKCCDLTVLYERKRASDRNAKWKSKKNDTFQEIYSDLIPLGSDKSIGNYIKKHIMRNRYDLIIFNDYISPSCILAIHFCKSRQIKYVIEFDGGFCNTEHFIKKVIKKHMLNDATGYLTTCDQHIEYLESLGIGKSRIFKYPFTSIRQSDLTEAQLFLKKDRPALRQSLKMTEKNIILSVGRFSYDSGYGKGFDILMKIAKALGRDYGIYIVGDEPTDEFIKWKEKEKLENIHFEPFKTKSELAEYYAAADVFVLLTRGDVWGLVVNEAMSFGLPVGASDQCVAATELVQNGLNGYIVSLSDDKCIIDTIKRSIGDDALRKASSKTITSYTIEKMVERHLEIFKELGI